METCLQHLCCLLAWWWGVCLTLSCVYEASRQRGSAARHRLRGDWTHDLISETSQHIPYGGEKKESAFWSGLSSQQLMGNSINTATPLGLPIALSNDCIYNKSHRSQWISLNFTFVMNIMMRNLWKSLAQATEWIFSRMLEILFKELYQFFITCIDSLMFFLLLCFITGVSALCVCTCVSSLSLLLSLGTPE